MKYAKVDNTEIVVAKERIFAAAFLWQMRAFIFVDNEKAVAQMIDDLFQHTRKSMKVIDDDDDVLCYSEKKTPHPPIHSLSSSFSFCSDLVHI